MTSDGESEASPASSPKRLKKKSRRTPPASGTDDARLVIRLPGNIGPRAEVKAEPLENMLDTSETTEACKRCARGSYVCSPGTGFACAQCQRSKTKCTFSATPWQESDLNHRPRKRSQKQRPTSRSSSRRPSVAPSAAPQTAPALPSPHPVTSQPSSVVGAGMAAGDGHTDLTASSEALDPAPAAEVCPSSAPPHPSSMSPAVSEHPRQEGLPSFESLVRASGNDATMDALTAEVRSLRDERVMMLRRIEELEAAGSNLRREVEELRGARAAHAALLEGHRVQLVGLSTVAHYQPHPQPQDVNMEDETDPSKESTPPRLDNRLSPPPIPIPSPPAPATLPPTPAQNDRQTPVPVHDACIPLSVASTLSPSADIFSDWLAPTGPPVPADSTMTADYSPVIRKL